MSLVIKKKGNLLKHKKNIIKYAVGQGFKNRPHNFINNVGGIPDFRDLSLKTQIISLPERNNNYKPISREQELRHPSKQPIGFGFQQLSGVTIKKKLNNLKFEL